MVFCIVAAKSFLHVRCRVLQTLTVSDMQVFSLVVISQCDDVGKGEKFRIRCVCELNEFISLFAWK